MEQHVSGSLQQQHMNMRLSRTNIFFSVFHCLLLLLLLRIQENIYRRGIRKNKRTNKFQPIFFRLHFSSSHIYALSATAAGYCCLMVLCMKTTCGRDFLCAFTAGVFTATRNTFQFSFPPHPVEITTRPKHSKSVRARYYGSLMFHMDAIAIVCAATRINGTEQSTELKMNIASRCAINRVAAAAVEHME